jgi:hypothetical protein
VILSTRADGSDVVKIGSGWQRVSGDPHLKLDLLPLGYQQIVVRAVASGAEVKPKALARCVRWPRLLRVAKVPGHRLRTPIGKHVHATPCGLTYTRKVRELLEWVQALMSFEHSLK